MLTAAVIFYSNLMLLLSCQCAGSWLMYADVCHEAFENFRNKDS